MTMVLLLASQICTKMFWKLQNIITGTVDSNKKNIG